MAAAAPSALAASTETTNGVKLGRLLVDGGTAVLRKVFDGIHPPTKLVSKLHSHNSTLDNLHAHGILTKEQWDLLFPGPKGPQPNSKSFDITLLSLLLTEICGLSPPPRTGWYNKPHAKNKSLEANLVRIKVFRNKLIQKARTPIGNDSFNELWKELSGVLVALGLGQAEIDKLKAERCGEEDYLGLLFKWADREKDVMARLEELRQSQTKTHKAVENVSQIQQEHQILLQGTSKAVATVCETQREQNVLLQGTNQAVERLSQTQEEQNALLKGTKQVVETVCQTHQEHFSLLQDANAKLEDARQIQHVIESKVQAIHQTQTKTHEVLETFGENLHEIKQAVSSSEEKKARDKEEEILQKLFESEFKGDIEYHVGRFQEGTREWVFNKVQNWLDDRNSKNRVMVISANAGMGKSVISAVICKRMQETGRLSGSHFCQHDNARYRNPQLMLQSLACHLCHALPEYKQALVKKLSGNLGKDDLNNMGVKELFALLFKEPLSTVADPGRNMLMVIDGLDESDYQERNELLDVIAKHFCKLPPWIRFLCTTRPERNIAKTLKQLKPFLLEPNEEENVQDIRRLFEERMQSLMKLEIKGAIVEKLVEKSEGLMLYAHFLVSYIEENVSVLDQEDLDASLPLNISSVYESYFQRLEDELKKLDIEEEYFRKLLCAVTASREPLPIDFVSRVLIPCADPLAKSRKVLKAISSVSSLLPIRNECLQVFHKSVKDWLTDKLCYGEHDFTVDEKEGHRTLANLCCNELDNLKQKGVHDTQFSSTVKYALHHCARHMLQLHEDKRSRSLKEIVQSYVLDLELMYAKLCLSTSLAAVEIFWLQSQKTSQVHDEEIKGSLKALILLLRRHFNTFSNHPRVFFQTVLNEGGPVLSTVVSTLLQNKYPEIPYMEFVHEQLERGAVLARFQCSSFVICFDVSPQLDYMVCKCSNGTIQLWSINTGNREWIKPVFEKVCVFLDAYRRDLHRAKDEDFHGGFHGDDFSWSFYRSVVFHPNGKLVLPGSLCEVYTIGGEQTQLFSKSDCRFSVCTFVKDKTRMLTDCPNNSKCIVMWNLHTGKEISRITRKEDILCFQCSQDRTLLAISHVTGLICLVGLVNGLTELGEISTSQACGFVNFSPDNQILFCLHLSDWSKCLFRLSIESGNTFQEVDQISIPKRSRAHFLVEDALGNSSKQLSRVINFWDVGFFKQLNDESALMSSPDLDCVSLINLNKLKEVRLESETVVTDIVFSRNGAIVYVVSRNRAEIKTTVTVWDCTRWERKAVKQMWVISLVSVREGVVVLSFDQDVQDSRLELWDVELSACKRRWTDLEGIQQVITISDERVACVGGCDVTVLSTTNDFLEAIKCDNTKTVCVAMNTKTQLLTISRIYEHTWELWICEMCKATSSWSTVWGEVEEDVVPQCMFSPREEFCVIWDFNCVHVLYADTGKLHRKLLEDGMVFYCKFVSDKELIVWSKEYHGNFLQMFDVRSGELLNLIEIEEEPFCLGTCLYNLHIAVGLSGSEFKLLRLRLPRVEDNSNSERGLDNLDAIESKQATGTSLKRRGESPSCSSSKRSKVTPDQSAAAVIKEDTPEDVELESLAEKIPGHWKKLGRRLLEGDEALLEAIHKENEEYSEKAYKMLLRWKRAKGSRATFRVLHEALCHPLVNRQDLAEEICLKDHG